MSNNYITLIVEDSGLIVRGIKILLKEITESKDATFEIHYATKYSKALSILKDEPYINLVFLDVKLPKEPEVEMFSGEDLGVEIRLLHPSALILVIIAPNNPVLIHRIMEKFAPDGLFVKGDIKLEEFTFAISKALTKPPYYSSTALKYIVNGKYNKLILTKRDEHLLILLDKGLTLEQIGAEILISKSAVAKRKKRLKELLGVEDGNDRDLVNSAREIGLIE